jgi:hypothetical protein
MRQRIDLDKIYGRAVRRIEVTRYDERPTLTPPATCPLTLDQLLTASIEDLEAAVSAHIVG